MKKRHKRIRKNICNAVLTVFSLLCAILFLFPTVLTITNSFMAKDEITANYGSMIDYIKNDAFSIFVNDKLNLKLIPDIVSIEQYFSVLLKEPEYLMKFWNSVIIVVPIVVFQLIISLMASYAFAMFKGRIKEIVFFFYIILMLMPYQVTLVPNYLVADKLGLLNTRCAIILPGIFSPFSVFLFTKIMKRIPVSVIEAAKLDGASHFQLFFQICIPMIKNTILSVMLLVFIDFWNMVELPVIMLENSDYHPLSVFLSKINTDDIVLAFSVAVIYMIPPLLLFFFGEEYLVEGITYSGSVKG